MILFQARRAWRALQSLRQLAGGARSRAVATAVLAGVALAGPVAAQAPAAGAVPPTLRILVGFPAGGGLDAVARVYADALREVLKTNVVVENRPGAGGAIAAQGTVTSPASQPTLLYAIDHQVAILRHIMKNPGFDAERDLVPLGRIVTYEMCLAVHSSVAARTLPEYIAAAKADPALANYAVPAPGSNAQFIGHALATHFGARLNAIPYRGAAPALQDLAGGQVKAAVMPCDAFIGFVRSGQVKVLGIAGDKRSPRWPEVAAMSEAGVQIPGTLNFSGVYAPRGMDPALVARLVAATREAFNLPGVAAKLDATGQFAAYASADELARLGSQASAFWAAQVKSSGFAAMD